MDNIDLSNGLVRKKRYVRLACYITKIPMRCCALSMNSRHVVNLNFLIVVQRVQLACQAQGRSLTHARCAKLQLTHARPAEFLM